MRAAHGCGLCVCLAIQQNPAALLQPCASRGVSSQDAETRPAFVLPGHAAKFPMKASSLQVTTILISKLSLSCSLVLSARAAGDFSPRGLQDFPGPEKLDTIFESR